MSREARAWARALLARSVTKREKLHRIEAALGPTRGSRCLDIGSGDGVVSLLLRERGGTWHSADLAGGRIAGMREVLENRVHPLTAGDRLPFPDASFDVAVVIDLLEHLEDDRALVEELARILGPGGRLVVNVPYRCPAAWINRLRHAVGLTDARHGHVRPGYTEEDVVRLLGPEFSVMTTDRYSHAPLELLDVALNVAGGPRVDGRGTRRSAFGRRDLGFRLLGLATPILKLVTLLDRALPWPGAYKLVATARRAVPAGESHRP